MVILTLTLLASVGLALAWIVTANIVLPLKRARARCNKGSAWWWVYSAVGYFVVFVFLLADIGFNLTFALPLFLDKWQSLTLTSRLQFYLHEDRRNGRLANYRYALAHFLCYRVVEPQDPDHCVLSKLPTGRKFL